MNQSLLHPHEHEYIRNNSQNRHLVDNAYVPKELTVRGNRYVFYLTERKLQVISKQVDKTKCLVGKEGWTIQ